LNILSIFAVFYEDFCEAKFEAKFKINQDIFYLIEQASSMRKITLAVIVFAHYLNKKNKIQQKKDKKIHFLEE